MDFERQQRQQAVTRTAMVGAVVNVLLASVKIAAGSVGQSYSLIVDGIHSLSDLLSDLLVWLAGRKASQGPDLDHPYGHARFETAATLILGGLLGAVAVGIAWDAVARLFRPESLLQPGLIALVAAAASILTKEWLYWYTLGYARRVRSEMLRANAWHHRSDAISSVIVLVGVVGTLLGLAYLDAIAAIAVCLMIAKIAWELISGAMRELVDTGLEPDRLAAVRRTIQSVGGVRSVHMLRTRRLAGKASVDVHVLVDPRISVSEGHMVSLMVEEQLKADIDEIVDVTVHVDPEDDEHRPRCSGLPLRPEVLVCLDFLWSDIPMAARRQRTVLHYLSGGIDIEIYFPLGMYDEDPEAAHRLCRLLRSALADERHIRALSVYFGGRAHL
jgi:cation diffusion facilitator family transporter